MHGSLGLPETSCNAPASLASMDMPFILMFLLNTVLVLCDRQCSARACKPSSMNRPRCLDLPAVTQLNIVTACTLRISSTPRSLPLVLL